MSILKSLSIKAKAQQNLERYKRNEEGGFAVMASISIAVILGSAAVAVDIANAQSAKSRLQSTTDAIALMAAKSEFVTQGELDKVAKEYFEITYPGANGSRIKIKEVRRDSDKVTVVAENSVNAYFSRIFGETNLGVVAESSAIYANKAMDIALVLDTTGSMEGSKLAALKKAAGELVETIDKQNANNVRMSVVPFAQYVNVGTKKRNASWLDVPNDEKGKRTRNVKVPGGKCEYVTVERNNDGKRTKKRVKRCETTPTQENYTATWKGCVGSRSVPMNTVAAYNRVKIPGLLENRASCGSVIKPLTKNLLGVKNSINGLVARGQTYMPSGLIWGWRTLDGHAPFTEVAKGSKGTKKSDKVLILMTDGDNTKSKRGVFHYGNDTSQADKTTEALCGLIKDENIKMYTIAYDVSSAKTKTLLQDCATANSNYFEAKTARNLNDAFKKIAADLNQLRITS